MDTEVGSHTKKGQWVCGPVCFETGIVTWRLAIKVGRHSYDVSPIGADRTAWALPGSAPHSYSAHEVCHLTDPRSVSTWSRRAAVNGSVAIQPIDIRGIAYTNGNNTKQKPRLDFSLRPGPIQRVPPHTLNGKNAFAY